LSIVANARPAIFSASSRNNKTILYKITIYDFQHKAGMAPAQSLPWKN
jgi:hypothetical protein